MAAILLIVPTEALAEEKKHMAPMLRAKRWTPTAGWHECSIFDATFLRKAVYRCLVCDRHVVPHGDMPTARFKHVTVSPNCPYSRRKPLGRRRRRA